eukprot:CAMPEP_0179454974 /NCGR_PEP_ID=MMETSP0799-20121207/38958_1 /TAXON_ID=46947 /ORGANISM="Geminigera cryophila, Strain CCMP2564" /LENGTH=103 /DNA_ID=CAMNT_0021253629 /DNA_START=177 /DNA_END=486 /DNA_ORIENTATION=+
MKTVMGEIQTVTRAGVEKLVKDFKTYESSSTVLERFHETSSKGNHQVKDANADNPRTHWGLAVCKDCGDSATRERQRERSSCKRAILGRVEHVEEKADAEEKE